MAQVIIRNLNDEIVVRLKQRAKAHGRKLEQELREILKDAIKPARADLAAEVDRIRAMTPPGLPPDTTRIVCEGRASR